MSTTVELDKAGRIVVPKRVREAVGIRAGDRLDVEIRGKEVVLRSQRQGKDFTKIGVYGSTTPAPA